MAAFHFPEALSHMKLKIEYTYCQLYMLTHIVVFLGEAEQIKKNTQLTFSAISWE